MGVWVRMRTPVREVIPAKGSRDLVDLAANQGLLGECFEKDKSREQTKTNKWFSSRNRNTGRGQLEVGRRRPVQHR